MTAHPFQDLIENLRRLLDEGSEAEKYLALEAIHAISWSAFGRFPPIRPLIPPFARVLLPSLVRIVQCRPMGPLCAPACKALGSLQKEAESAIPDLCNVMLTPLEEGYDSSSESAAAALGLIGSPRALPALIQAAQDRRSQGPGWQAVGALRRFGPEAASAIPTLIELLDDPKVAHRGNALETLARIGAESTVACDAVALILETSTEEPLRESAAFAAIALLRGNSPATPRGLRKLIPHMLDDANTLVRREFADFQRQVQTENEPQ